jgi:formimidoylglutamate deiminase
VAPQGWAGAAGAATGAGLHARALLGGAQACARPIGALGQGRRADLVVLDAEHPLLVGRAGDRLVDSYIFAGNDSPVQHVMVGGEWVVRDGKHRDRERIAAAFRATMKRLAS